ncbi:MAG: hypothetical protein LQ348_007348 [Seirophora lacunosa]|nr:MAG: hypothetical protein LQ348_007348 [Seirophora lacunosa]
MLAAGSGIAPFRAFCQERASILGPAGERSVLGPAVLYFGCRHPDRDFLYREEFTQWERQGVVRVVGCFSKPTGEAEGRRVPDALWEDREWLTRLICSEGAHVYVCGSAARLGRSVVDVLRRVGREVKGYGEREAEEWLEGLKAEGRFVSDVY